MSTTSKPARGSECARDARGEAEVLNHDWTAIGSPLGSPRPRPQRPRCSQPFVGRGRAPPRGSRRQAVLRRRARRGHPKPTRCGLPRVQPPASPGRAGGAPGRERGRVSRRHRVADCRNRHRRWCKAVRAPPGAKRDNLQDTYGLERRCRSSAREHQGARAVKPRCRDSRPRSIQSDSWTTRMRTTIRRAGDHGVARKPFFRECGRGCNECRRHFTQSGRPLRGCGTLEAVEPGPDRTHGTRPAPSS